MQTLPSTALVPNPFQRERAPDEGAAPEGDASRVRRLQQRRRLQRETAPEGDGSSRGRRLHRRSKFQREKASTRGAFMHLCLLQREKDPKGNGSRGSNSEGQPIGGPRAFMTSSSSIGLDCDESLDAYMFIYLMLGAYWLHCLASGQSWSLSCREGVSGHSATSTSYTW